MKVKILTLNIPNLKDVSNHFEKKIKGLDLLNICGCVCFSLKVPLGSINLQKTLCNDYKCFAHSPNPKCSLINFVVENKIKFYYKPWN